MLDGLARWHNCLRVAALLALVAGLMILPSAAEDPPPCTVCEPDSQGVWDCRPAAEGQRGFNGKCYKTESGCRWDTGEECTGQGRMD
jgi:hypothetical protein